MKNTILFLLTFFFVKGFSQSPGCPQITPIGATICQGQCGNLNATAITNNQTTSYNVASIPYTPFPYTGGTAVSVGTDDVWSGAVPLGFNFCFYGTSYNQIWLGSNGQICFTPKTAGSTCNYPVTVGGALPSAANTPANTINVFRDIDPSVPGNNVRYYIGGAAPCRYLVFYFNNVALYSCGTPRSTFQMVLYENTNFIDIYIGNSSGSCSWQSGRGIVGIQNAAATAAVVAPGRNASNGNWTAVNEGWRFSPSGAPSYAVTWRGPGNVVVGTGLGPISVCPTTNTTYTASMVVTNCDNATTTYVNTALVTVNNSPTVTIAPSATLNCSGNTIITTAVTPMSTYAWSGPGIVSGGGTGNPSVNQAGIYTVIATAAGCSRTGTISMAAAAPATITVNSPGVCLGNSVNLTGAGASTYTWLPGGSTTNPFSVSPNVLTTYTVRGTNASGCIGTAISTVSINPSPSAIRTFTNPTCGLNNGVIFINNTSSGGQTISSFASSLGSISGQTVTGLSAPSTPIVTLTNDFGCTFTVSTTLTVTPVPTNIVTNITNASCGASNGSVVATSVTGGVPAYLYSFNGGAFSAGTSATGLLAGNYSVTVRDANSCSFTTMVSIANASGPIAIGGTSSPTGCGTNTGAFNITSVSGGLGAYSFSVDAIATGSLTSGLAAGIHTVSVRDINLCVFTRTFSVASPSGPTSGVVAFSLAGCGLANATATVTSVTGGGAPYNYSYDGGAFSALTSTTGLAAGLHNVTIRDVSSCTVTVPFTVLNASSPNTSISAIRNVSCNGLSNGGFTVTAIGGNGAPFSYSLTTPFTVNGTGFFGGLPQGTYFLSVKDASLCSTTASVVITEPAVLTLTPTSIAARCFGTSTGTINVNGLGGTGAYMYNLNGGGFQTSSSFTTVPANTFIVGIRDINLCTLTRTITVTQPLALGLTLTPNNANCTAANGIITSTVSGGTPAYIYAWSGSGGSNSTTTPLIAGTYSLVVTDGNGCFVNSSAVIGVNSGGTAAITTPSNNITCNGLNNGRLTASPTGGASPFTYSWSPGGQTTSTAVNLAPGIYTCVVRDFNGCNATTVGTVTQPSVLSLLMSSLNVKCFGTTTGTISAVGSGGTLPYTYLWPALSSTLSTVNNVAVGNYSCIVTDASGCASTQTIAVTQPLAITLSSTITAANCNLPNGSTTVTVSGGTPAYTYTWSTNTNLATLSNVAAGTYTVNVKDGNNCTQTLSSTIPNLSGPTISVTSQTNVSCFGGNNGLATALAAAGTGTYNYSWSNGNITPTAGGLLQGIYTVSVTDVAGCIASTAVTITQPTALTINITPTNPKCFGSVDGSGLVAVLGGSPGYTYTWTSGGGSATTSNPYGAGVYGINVSDSKNCVATGTMNLINPFPMSATITSTNVSCLGQCNAIATATSTNGAGTISYFWTGGPSSIFGRTATGLCVGSYTVLATDQNNCTGNSVVVITQPPALSATPSSGSITCNGGTNGFVSVSAFGGTGALSYSWNGAAASAGNSSTANSLPAGSYSVTITDARSCSITAIASVMQPLPLSTTLTTTNPKCDGVCDGIANVAFTGGTGATTFLWEPSLQGGNSVNTLCAGNQTVTITSNGICTTKLTFNLTNPAPLTSVVTTSNSNCGNNNGRTCAAVLGGTPPLNYLWNNGITTLCNNSVISGAYTFTVTDNNLCTSSGSGLVNDVAGPIVTILSSTNVSCFGGNNGGVNTSITTTVVPYTVTWSGNPSINQNVTNFTAGLENITVTDAAGCVGTASINITQPTLLVSAISGYTDVTCFGLTNGGATFLANGGNTGGYTYSWTPSGQTTPVLANVGASTYTCVVRDSKNCSSAQTVIISQPSQIVMTSSLTTNISCNGGNNGSIITQINGGVPGYTYSWTPTQPNNGNLSGLLPGGYAVTVNDVNNCSLNANFTITEPTLLVSSYNSLPAKCGLANGSATISPLGGFSPYSITWNSSPIQSGAIASNLAPIVYQGTIIDFNNCSITQTVNVNAATSPTITNFTAVSPVCFGMANGSIIVNYIGGTAPYTVLWSNPISVVAPGITSFSYAVTGVPAGAYSATVTDSYGCKSDMPVNVLPRQQLLNNTTANSTICYGQNTQIYSQGVGGSPNGNGPYTYNWSPSNIVGPGPHSVNPLSPTSYSVFVTDASGCVSTTKVISINVTPQLLVASASYTVCQAESQVIEPIITSPGDGGPYVYAWSNGATSENITVIGNFPTSPNRYTLSVSDGCPIPATATMVVNVNPLPTGNFTGNILKGCAPLAVTLTGTSNNPDDLFTWSVVKNIPSIGNPTEILLVDSGRYNVTAIITNSLTGCSRTVVKSNYIQVYPQPLASFYAVPNTATILEPLISFTNTSIGASSYFWSFGDAASPVASNISTLVNPSHFYNFIGFYTVYLKATSDKGCIAEATDRVEITPEFAVYIPNTFTPDGNGINDYFLPMGVGINVDNFYMEIYDRWGEQVYSTKSFEYKKGWDGTIKGAKIGTQGVYTYKIVVYDLQGNKRPYVGHVTLLKGN